VAKRANLRRGMASCDVRRGFRLLVLLAAIGSLATMSVQAVAASRDGMRSPTRPVAGFNLLRQPTAIEALTLTERAQLRKALGDRPARGLREGEVRLAAGRVRGVGNGTLVCIFSKIESYGAGGCGQRRSVLKGGITFMKFCAGRSRDLARITGIVPNGVTAVRLNREDDGSVLGSAKVVSNAFTLIVSPVEATRSWVGPRSGNAVPYPLAQRASGSECPTGAEGP
jgi:hypothetical protein